MNYYRTDVPQTAAELFDGELVVANYESGLYYSVASGGALVWQGLRHGLSDQQVADWLAAGFPSENNLSARVLDFIGRLSDEGLVARSDVPEQGATLPPLTEAFGALEVERFEDLQELLLLDPVHDVAEAGWPHRADDK